MDRMIFASLAKIAAATDSKADFVAFASGAETKAIYSHIWDIAHCSIREIRDYTGMTQLEFANCYLISKRAIESWDGGQRTPPIYLKLLLAEVTGYMQIDLK